MEPVACAKFLQNFLVLGEGFLEVEISMCHLIKRYKNKKDYLAFIFLVTSGTFLNRILYLHLGHLLSLLKRNLIGSTSDPQLGQVYNYSPPEVASLILRTAAFAIGV